MLLICPPNLFLTAFMRSFTLSSLISMILSQVVNSNRVIQSKTAFQVQINTLEVTFYNFSFRSLRRFCNKASNSQVQEMIFVALEWFFLSFYIRTFSIYQFTWIHLMISRQLSPTMTEITSGTLIFTLSASFSTLQRGSSWIVQHLALRFVALHKKSRMTFLCAPSCSSLISPGVLSSSSNS